MSQNEYSIPQKYLDKILKMNQDQDNERKQEYELLKQHLAQMSTLLSDLIRVGQSGSTVASGKKFIPFHTGSQDVGQLITPPANPDDYPTKVDVYAINDNRVIPHMTLVNDGPGSIFFIVAYAKNQFNEREGHLNVNDQRELFNVYEVRLRSTLPLTTFRLIEGIFRTGSTAPQTRINVENRPTVQTNQVLEDFSIEFDNPGSITINSPTPQVLPVDNTVFGLTIQPPLPPGQTTTLVNVVTGEPMPFTIPEGFVLEIFQTVVNFNTDFTVRAYFEVVPGTFTLFTSFPSSKRGQSPNSVLNLSFFSTTLSFIDPFGAPPGGRKFLITVTNDDPFNNMLGGADVVAIMSRIT